MASGSQLLFNHVIEAQINSDILHKLARKLSYTLPISWHMVRIELQKALISICYNILIELQVDNNGKVSRLLEKLHLYHLYFDTF